jgi:hypothetical protein
MGEGEWGTCSADRRILSHPSMEEGFLRSDLSGFSRSGASFITLHERHGSLPL